MDFKCLRQVILRKRAEKDVWNVMLCRVTIISFCFERFFFTTYTMN